MGKIKMQDLHSFLDLMDEASGKTDSWLCLSIDSFGKNSERLSIDFVVFRKDKITGEQTRLFDSMFDVGKGAFRHEDGYTKAKNYLKKIINGDEANV